MNTYIDNEGYLCIEEEAKEEDEGAEMVLKWSGISYIITKRYKVNTTSGLFEEIIR